MRGSRLALILASSLSACGSVSELDPSQRTVGPTPRPTERSPGEDAEGERRQARAEWIEAIHRAPPGVDWRAIERQNRLREVERRNQLALMATGSGDFIWHEVGSANQAGRMMCGVLGIDGQTLYAGSHLGGVWRASLDGSDWTPVGDNLGGGVNEMVTLPGENAGDPEVIAVVSSISVLSTPATIFVTRDLGLTWEHAQGLDGVSDVRMFGKLDDLGSTLIACCTENGKVAIYASTDYGRTFQQRWQDSVDSAGWMWIPREGPAAQNTIFVVSRGRVWVSIDSGQTFHLRNTVDSNATTCVIAGSEAGAPDLYLVLGVGGQYQVHASHNAGATFQHVNDVVGWYWDGTLCASRTDRNLVMYGTADCMRSTDGGLTFAPINNWWDYYNDPATLLHADIPGIHCWSDPQSPADDVWYISTDGGVYDSHDDGATVRNLSLSGLGVSQFYSTLTSVNDTDLVVAGSQDQGYQRGFVSAPAETGPTSTFDQLFQGDFGSLTSSDGTHDLVYSSIPGYLAVQVDEIAPSITILNVPPGSPWPFIPFIVADPLNPESFFFGSDVLYRYDRTGPQAWSWSIHSSQDFTVGGGEYITAMAFAPSDPQRMYAVTTAGQIFVSMDHGIGWTNTSGGAPDDNFVYGQAIAVHPTDRDEVVIGGSGYGGDGVLRSIDGGQTWQPIVAGLPQTVVYGLTYAPDGSGDLYAGTECGAWHWDRGASAWENIMSNVAPVTIYWSVESVQPDIVRYGTYGRGIWDYRLPTPGAYAQYGTGKITSLGQEPRLTGQGTATVTDNDFFLHGDQGIPSQPGIVIWSYTPAATPFQGGTLWLAPPITRAATFQWNSSGSVSSPVNVDSALVGVVRYYQLWFRDPAHPDGTTVGLTNGLRVSFGL